MKWGRSRVNVEICKLSKWSYYKAAVDGIVHTVFLSFLSCYYPVPLNVV